MILLAIVFFVEFSFGFAGSVFTLFKALRSSIEPNRHAAALDRAVFERVDNSRSNGLFYFHERKRLGDLNSADLTAGNSSLVGDGAETEAEIAELDDEDKAMFLEDMGMHEPGLNRVIRAGYDLLGLQTYFTAGVKEVRAWTIHKGDTAPQAAGVIHTDFERGFIRAQTISYDDYIAYKGEKGAQEAGKMRAEGKDYVVADGDVMNFLFNV